MMWYLRARSSVHTLYVRSASEWERKCGCVRAGVMNMHNCVWRGVCVCLYIYEVLPQTFNLPQPGECAEERLGRCVLSPPSLRSPHLPLPLSIPSPPQVSDPHFSSQLFLHEFPSLNPAPSPPVVAPHAGANFRASSLDPSIQLEMPWRRSTSPGCAPPSARLLLQGM